MRDQQADSGWTSEVDALLGHWRNRVYAAQTAYYWQAERLWRWHYLLGIPIIFMSTVVSSSIFADKSGGIGIPTVVIGALGGLTAILASLQTFLKLAETATRNTAAADWYAAIRRDIEALQALPRHLRGDVRARLDLIRKDINKAGQNAPAIGEHLWMRVAERFGVTDLPLLEPPMEEP
jgi:hypothetical protein